MSRLLNILEIVQTTARHHLMEMPESRKVAMATACSIECGNDDNEIIDWLRDSFISEGVPLEQQS